MPEFEFRISLQLRYVLSYHAAYAILAAAASGNLAAYRLIEWYGRAR